MPVDFPAGPVEGQTYAINGITYVFQSGAWVTATSVDPDARYVNVAGDTMTGPLTVRGAPPTFIFDLPGLKITSKSGTSTMTIMVSDPSEVAFGTREYIELGTTLSMGGIGYLETQSSGNLALSIFEPITCFGSVSAIIDPDHLTTKEYVDSMDGALNTSIGSKEPAIVAGTTTQYWRGDKSWQTLDKAAVGLGNVDNTTDLNKPVSTATQTALNLKANLASPTFTGVPTAPTAAGGTNTTQIATTAFVTALGGTKEPTIAAGTTAQYWRGDKSWQTLDKAAVGLGNVDNTTDASKPVSTAQAAADALRVLKAGDTMTGNLIIQKGSPNFTLDAVGTTSGAVIWKRDNITLYSFFTSGTPLNLFLWRYDDAGVNNGTIMQVTRLTGEIGLGGSSLAGSQVRIVTPSVNTSEIGLHLHNQNNVNDSEVKLLFTRTNNIALGSITGQREGAANAGSLVFRTANLGVESVALTINSANLSAFSGPVTINSLNSLLSLTGAAGTLRNQNFQTAGVNRFQLRLNNVAEGGSNAGSNLQLMRFQDDGSNPDASTGALSVFEVDRATGQIAFNAGVAAGIRMHVAFQASENVDDGINLLLSNNSNISGNSSGIQFGAALGVVAPRATIRGQRSGNNGDFIIATAVSGVMTDTLTLTGIDRRAMFNTDTIGIATARTPASATAAGVQGQICWDANYVYVCTATNVWKRAALATW
jgi:hypothetical protein